VTPLGKLPLTTLKVTDPPSASLALRVGILLAALPPSYKTASVPAPVFHTGNVLIVPAGSSTALSPDGLVTLIP
jgi:hypothetical protein